jgi:uncharacterized protein YciI
MARTAEWTERFVLLYFSGPEGRERVRRRPDELLFTGPFAEPVDGQPGAMNVFTTREAAEEFAASDPFVVEGVVESWTVRTWLIAGE